MPEDKDIIKRFIDGDPEAFDQIFERYYRKVYAFSLRNFRNKEDAEGAVQEVFYNLWKDRSKLGKVKDFEGWIFTICLNIIRKYFRKLAADKKHFELFSDTYELSDNSTSNEVEYRDILEKTNELVEKLPPRQKTIFLLSREESLSNLEISEKLHISVRTVDNQLSGAKTFLRKALVDGSILSLLFFYFFVN